MRLSSFLRTVLQLDGISCLLMGAAFLLFLQPLAELSGLDAGLLSIAGGLLLPVGVFFLWLGSREQAAAALVMLAVVGNLGWVAASVFIATGWPGITTLGQAGVALQAVAVLAIAGLEWLGYRRSQVQPVIAYQRGKLPRLFAMRWRTGGHYLVVHSCTGGGFRHERVRIASAL